MVDSNGRELINNIKNGIVRKKNSKILFIYLII